jgi:hypothetical protein
LREPPLTLIDYSIRMEELNKQKGGKMSKVLRLTKLALILVALIGSSCEKTPTGPKNVPEVVVSEKTVVLEEKEDVSLKDITDSTYIFEFSGAKPKISEGDVLVGSEKGGYLRRIKSATIEDDKITVETGFATLTDAIIKGSLDTTIQLNIARTPKQGEQTSRLIYAAKGVSVAEGVIPLSGVQLFSGTIGSAKVEVSITKGSIEFDPVLDLGFEIDNGIKEFHAIAEGYLNYDCELLVDASDAFNYSHEINIATFQHTAVQFVGFVPIVEVITVRFDAGFECSASGSGTTNFGANGGTSVSVGARYGSGKWSAIWHNDMSLNGQLGKWELENIKIRGYVKPSISVELYSFAGPYIEVDPYLGFNGEISTSSAQCWSWDIYGGIDGYLGFQASILNYTLADYSSKLLKWETTLADDGNCGPYPPTYPSPSNGAKDQPIDVDLTWKGGDPEGDPVSYDIYFGTSNSPCSVRTVKTEAYDPGILEYNTKYYWKIVARDNQGLKTSGPLWEFTTEDQPCTDPPTTPCNPNPDNGSINISTNNVTLSWGCGTSPCGYKVCYDVYFGASSTPPKVKTCQSEKTYDPGALEYNTTYYWKIVAKDDRGRSTSGDVWNFETENQPCTDPPTKPASLNPNNGIANVSIDIDLSWGGGISPCGYNVCYDVYFGTSSSPPKVSTCQNGKTYDPGILNHNTTYYWKIVAKDDHGKSTSGDVWNFKTGDQPCTDPPTKPASPNPNNGAANISIDADLSWSSSTSPCGYNVCYDVYFGTGSSPPKVKTCQSGKTYDPGTLSHNTTYYWKIVAKDDHGKSSSSTLGSFTTEDQPCTDPPTKPINPNPGNGTGNASIDTDLSWGGGTSPCGYNVCYDVYFGTSSSPPKVSTCQNGKTYDPGILNHNTTYYWKIVAKDDHGKSTSGDVWHFTTGIDVSVPDLISPEEGATMDNGRTDRNDDIIWDFDWSDCIGATQYHLYVMHTGSSLPVIDDTEISGSSYHYVNPGAYITDTNRFNWTWKVRTKVDGQWSEWSEIRTFDVEPVNSDPPLEICIPDLISPNEGAIMDNGRTDRLDDIIWDFDWSDCIGATQYHLYVMHTGSSLPVIDDTDISGSSYHYVNPGAYITDANRFDWTWKVKAKVDGQWGDWSEIRTFDVEPVNTDPPSP